MKVKSYILINILSFWSGLCLSQGFGELGKGNGYADPDDSLGQVKKFKSLRNEGLNAREMVIAVNNYLSGPLESRLEQIQSKVEKIDRILGRGLDEKIRQIVKTEIDQVTQKLQSFKKSDYDEMLNKLNGLEVDELSKMRDELEKLKSETLVDLQNEVESTKRVIRSMESVLNSVSGIKNNSNKNKGSVIPLDKRP